MSIKCMTRAAHALQEKKRLEEALLELQRVNESLLDAARPEENTDPAVYSMSAESAQLLGQLRSRQRVYCPVSGLERSSGGLSADAQKDEVQVPSWSMPVSIYWESCEVVKACDTLSVALAHVWPSISGRLQGRGVFPCPHLPPGRYKCYHPASIAHVLS